MEFGKWDDEPVKNAIKLEPPSCRDFSKQCATPMTRMTIILQLPAGQFNFPESKQYLKIQWKGPKSLRKCRKRGLNVKNSSERRKKTRFLSSVAVEKNSSHF